MAVAGRHLARRCAVQALYQWGVTGQAHSEIERSFIQNDNLLGRHLQYFQRLIENVPRYVDQLDATLTTHLDRSLEKVDLLEHAILRVGAYELLYERDIPTRVILNEAIGIAKLYTSEHSYKYINGVLDKVAQEVRD